MILASDSQEKSFEYPGLLGRFPPPPPHRPDRTLAVLSKTGRLNRKSRNGDERGVTRHTDEVERSNLGGGRKKKRLNLFYFFFLSEGQGVRERLHENFCASFPLPPYPPPSQKKSFYEHFLANTLKFEYGEFQSTCPRTKRQPVPPF